MEIIYEVLHELNYKSEQRFSFKIDEGQKYEIAPFISMDNPSQVFLVTELKYSDLGVVLKGKYLSILAREFCRQDFHKSDMDRNTSLLIKAFGTEEELKDSSEKIKIEDDPYYFKKYVLSSTEYAEKKVVNYFNDRRTNCKEGEVSLILEMQNYLLKTDMFNKYKDNPYNEMIYSYFVELSTKIPVIPLKVSSSNDLNSVDFYLNKFLNNEEDVHIKAIEQFISSSINFNEDNIETFLDSWQECLNKTGD